MKDKQVKEYVNADKKARKLWGLSKTTDNPKKQAKLRNRAKDAYAEKEALAMKLQNPKTEIKTTNIKVSNSFNDNFNKTKKTNISPKVKFSWKKK